MQSVPSTVCFLFFRRRWPQAHENGDACRSRAIDGLQDFWDAVGHYLCANGGGQMRHELDVAIVAERVSLNAADRLFLKSRRQRILADDQLIRPLGIFDSSPDVIFRMEAQR